MPRPLLGLLVALATTLVVATGCRSKTADEQTLQELGATASTASATTGPRATTRPENPPTTRRGTTTSSRKGTATTEGSEPELPSELTGDVAAACAALRKVSDLDQQLRRSRPTSLDELKATLGTSGRATDEAYGEVVAAVGADTPLGREFQTLRDATNTLTDAYLRAATFEEASDVPLDQAEATGEALGATLALNDPVRASCGFPLSSQLG
ncbi:MAG: hypothetical protein R2726_05980 [Acidimicrobiales bacterium]